VVVRGEVVELPLYPCGVFGASLVPVQRQRFAPHRAGLVVLAEGDVRAWCSM
jgi:hypothetical protein